MRPGTHTVAVGHLTATLRECWVDAGNLRLSGTDPGWTSRPTVHAVVVEIVAVEEAHRRRGECRAFLNQLCSDGRFDMVVVEAVQNPVLAEALLRWGWDCDPGVMDFYWKRSDHPCAAGPSSA